MPCNWHSCKYWANKIYAFLHSWFLRHSHDYCELKIHQSHDLDKQIIRQINDVGTLVIFWLVKVNYE